ncbi:hypothetical protein K2224_17745 [Streptomyces sp. BHT-5-2]|nr:hypothetical protein K2224_17745 [Streptomyces sp. BHT-5-2]
MTQLSLREEPLDVIVPARHRFAARTDGIDLAEAAEETWVRAGDPHDQEQLLTAAGLAAGFTPGRRMLRWAGTRWPRWSPTASGPRWCRASHRFRGSRSWYGCPCAIPLRRYGVWSPGAQQVTPTPGRSRPGRPGRCL